jgi:hypothetical protein
MFEDRVLSFNLSSSDPDGDALSYSVSPTLDFVSLVDNGDGTGQITLSPGTGDAGSYNLTIKVMDSQDNSDSETIKITIQAEEPENRAPILSSISNVRITEGRVKRLNLSSVDPDGDDRSFSMSPNLDFIVLTDYGDGTGEITISPDQGDAGNYNLVIKVTDSNDESDSEAITLIVDKEEGVNKIPFLNPIGDQLVYEGAVLEIALSADDLDEDYLKFSVSPELGFLNLIDNGNGTAMLQITPDIGDAGKYSITVKVTDTNGGSTSYTFSLSIYSNANARFADVINSGGNTIVYGSMLAQEDKYYSGGKAATRPPSFAIEGTEDKELYRSVRFGDFKYEIPVPEPGSYMVRLHFAEITYNDFKRGDRVFNVNVENNQESLINYDIIAETGIQKAIVKTFTGIKVTDGYLSIDVKTVIRNALISAIEVINEVDKVTGLTSNELKPKISIYPNPSEGMFTIELPSDNLYTKGSTPYTIYNTAGKIILQSSMTSSRDIINLYGEKRGIYLIKVGDYKTEKLFIY